MSDFLSSEGWFTLSFVMFVVSFGLVTYPDFHETKFTGGLITTIISCFVFTVVCLICGFRAPEKIEHKDIKLDMSDIPHSVMEKTILEAFNQMPNDMKYKILTERMK